MSVIRPEAIPEPWDLAFYSSEEPVVGPVGPSLLGSMRCEVRMAYPNSADSGIAPIDNPIYRAYDSTAFGF